MLRYLLLLIFLATPALSQVPIVDRCSVDGDRLTCTITNPGDISSASIIYTVVASEEGRSVPWGFSSGEIDIAGGVEPGESFDIEILAPGLPPRAAGRDIKYKVNVTQVRTSGGEWRSEDIAPANHLTEAEKLAISESLGRCWNAATLSPEAMRTTVVVRMEIGSDSKPISTSISLVGSNGGSDSAARQAYEAARRAVLQCGSQGLPLPLSGSAVVRVLNIAFDASGIRP